MTAPAPAPRTSLLRALRSRVHTVAQLLGYFSKSQRYFLIPLLLVLLLGSVLLALTEGIGFIAPFVYTLF